MYDDLTRLRIEATTVCDKLLTAADRYPNRPTLIFPDRRITFAEMVEAAYRRARGLYALGVRSGDHVGVLMPNCIEYMEFVYGTALLGAVSVLINARYQPPELAYVVHDADLKVIVTTNAIDDYTDFGALLHSAFPELCDAGSGPLQMQAAPELRHLVMLGSGSGSIPGFTNAAAFDGLSNADAPIDTLRARVRINDPAIMMYTSGTTANPKGCPLSHEILVRNGINMNRRRYFMAETDVFWAPLPMFHMAAILPAMACLDAGAAMLSATHFDAGVALTLMERERVTIAFPAFPTITNEIISHPRFKTTDLSAIRRINNVAPVEMLRKFQDAFPQAIQTGAYGMTEVGGVISFNHPAETLEQRLDTCGTPMPGVSVRVVNTDTLEDVPINTRGELWIKGYCVFAGYHKAPEKNAEAFHEGWFRTGDLCSLDERGAIRFHGRIKDMLKVGGENVAAVEIESHLAAHPAVKMAAVIGIPDPRLEEVPVAFVELLPGRTATDAELIAHCKGQLASFKVPRAIHFVTEWPMSSTKVQKFKLKEMAATGRG